MDFLKRIFTRIGGTEGERELLSLIDRSMSELQRATAALDTQLQLAQARWDVDMDAGTLVFTALDGTIATCAVQVIGTLDTTNNTWLWGWDHPSVPKPLAVAAEAVRAWGAARGIERFTTRTIEATEEECWEHAAVAFHLTEAAGAYRGPSDPALVFMTFDDVRVEGPGANRAPQPALVPGDLSLVPDDARAAALGFLADRYAWELDASAQDRETDPIEEEDVDHDAIMDHAQQTHATLVKRWYAGAVLPQAIAFSSHPSFEPGRFQLVQGACEGDRAMVTTTEVDEDDFHTDHEVHLVKEDGGWRISSLVYVDDDGARWEGL